MTLNCLDMAGLLDDEFVVAFAYGEQSGLGIRVRIWDSAGQPVTEDVAVNTYFLDQQNLPAVAGFLDGGMVVVWTSEGQDGQSGGVFGQRLDSAGSLMGSEFAVHAYVTDDQTMAGVAALPDGSFVVVWQSGQDGDDWGIFAQRFDKDGNKLYH